MKACLVLNSSRGMRKSKAKMIRAQYERKKTLLQKHDKKIIKSLQRYMPKISVEHIKSNLGFYLYLYKLGI
jgi:ferric iron reductase protein FhuF